MRARAKLHRESSFVPADWANAEFGRPYEQLAIRIAPVRARAFERCLAHFADVFMKGNAAYAIPSGSVSTAERMRQFAPLKYFFVVSGLILAQIVLGIRRTFFHLALSQGPSCEPGRTSPHSDS